jgi:uncharacterized protein involved in exopolysaccharide biosynthesis
LVLILVRHVKLLTLVPLAAGVLALGISFLVAPTFTARATFLPPQQQQSASASLLASLGNLAGLAGAGANIKSPTDQYVSLMQSETVSDRIIEQFNLMRVYDAELRSEARLELSKRRRVNAGKKDGLITIEVDDKDPKRAADIANRHVEELQRLTGKLVLSEAQQRRAFFEKQLSDTKDRLAQAQAALEESGFNATALKAEPRAAAEGYARLQAEATAAEVRLSALRRTLADTAPEILQLRSTLAALRSELSKIEASSGAPSGSANYVGKYREFKYQEALFETFARQYEIARLDESREGSVIQVIDPARPPERKSAPKRALVAIVTTLATFVLLLIAVVARDRWREALRTSDSARKISSLLRAAKPN